MSKEKETSPNQDPEEQKIQEALKIFDISPEMKRTARKLYAAISAPRLISSQLELPHIQEIRKESPDLILTLRVGMSVQMKITSEQFRKAADDYLENTAEHKKYLGRNQNNPEEFRQFHMLLQKIRSYRDLFLLPAKEIVAWMNYTLEPEMKKQIPFVQEVPSNNLLDIILHLTKQFAENRREHLHSDEYIGITKLLLHFIKQERKRNAKIRSADYLSQETLGKLFAEFLAVRENEIADKDLSVPSSDQILLQTYKAGEPIMNVFRAFVKHIPKVLTQPDDPAHQITQELFDLTNTFTLPELNINSALAERPFTYQFIVGMITRDLLEDKENVQEFVYKLGQAVKSESTNTQWHTDFLNDITQLSPAKEVFILDAQNFPAIFPEQVYPQEETDLVKMMNVIMEYGSTPFFTLVVGEDVPQAEEMGIIAEDFRTRIQAKKIRANSYLVRVGMFVQLPERDENDATQSFKLRFNIQVENGKPIVTFPILNSEILPGEIKHRALEHITRCLNTAYSSIIEEIQAKESSKQSRTEKKSPSPAVSKKSGDRTQRKAEYQPKGQIKIDRTREMVGIEFSSVESDTLKAYLPQQLVLSTKLEQHLYAASSKIVRSVLYPATRKFLEEYNATENIEEKLPEGKMVAMLRGHNGEIIWRFAVTTTIRFNAIEVGNGKALVFSVDDHPDSEVNIAKLEIEAQKEQQKFNERKK